MKNIQRFSDKKSRPFAYREPIGASVEIGDLEDEILLKEDKDQKGVAGGYASLDGGGLIPSTQLPSYIDDVVEVADYASLPSPGETGKIYITMDTNLQYRWSGSDYISVSAVSSVAGKTGDVTLVEADITDLDKYSQNDINTLLLNKEDKINKGEEEGYAELDKTGLVPYSQKFLSGGAKEVRDIEGLNLWISSTQGEHINGGLIRLSKDFSGKGHNATQRVGTKRPFFHEYTDEIVNEVRGKEALYLDGSSRILISDTPDLQMQNFKISFLIKTTEDGQTILNKGVSGGDNYMIGIENNRINFLAYDSDGVKGFTSGAGTIVTDGKWHTVEVGFDGVDYWEIWIDGNLDSFKTESINAGGLLTSTYPVNVGARGTTAGDFTGNIRNLVIENLGTATIPASLPLESNSLDVSGNDNHGTEEGTVIYENQIIIPSNFEFDGADDFLKISKVKTDNDSTWVATFNTLVDDETSYLMYRFPHPGGLQLRFKNSSFARFYHKNEAGDTYYVDSTKTSAELADGNPHILIAIVKENNQLELYIDGALDGTTPFPFNSLKKNDYGEITIGGRYSLAPFKGGMSDSLLFEKALTEEERKKVEMYLAQKTGMILPYHTNNTVAMFDKAIGSLKDSNISMDEAGVITVDNFIKLGLIAPAIKIKKLTGITSNSEGGSVSVAHGLTGDKILGLQVKILNDTNSGCFGHCEQAAEKEFHYDHDATNVNVVLSASKSADLTSKSFTVIITYEG